MTPRSTLTSSERATLEAIIDHGSGKAAARALGLSHRTVEVHCSNARFKLGVHHTLCACIKYDRARQAGMPL